MSPAEMHRFDVPNSPFFQPLWDAELQVSWENLGSATREDYYLFIGVPLRQDSELERVIAEAELLEMMKATGDKLRKAGITEAPALFARWARYDEEACSSWLEALMLECLSIRPGMTRDDLWRVYEKAAGLNSGGIGERYWHRECRYVHVDVDFCDAESDTFTEAAVELEDLIIRISPPYLAIPSYD